MDFYQIKETIDEKKDRLEIRPDFIVKRSKDLMVRGKSFYAVWDDEKQLWSTDEYDIQRLVDQHLMQYALDLHGKTGRTVITKLMSDFSTRSWAQFRQYLSHLSDNSSQLDTSLVFQNTEVKKKDYVSRRLPYSLEEGPIPAYDEVIGTLYSPEERQKIEWAIGAIISGDAKDIQKFIVLYGEMGTGKSTILNIIQQLFEGYYITFDAKALTSNNNSFSTEVFRSNPLIAIQHEGDLSRIEDNTKLNSIVSHEQITINEKHKPQYSMRINSFLFMATNKPVKITDGKSGIIRRLIDVRPSGNKIPTKRYHTLMSQIGFELGSIAFHCLKVYRNMGKNYYGGYRPLDMMLQTDVFYNFVEDNFYTFKQQDGISLSQAYEMYKVYCTEALVDFKLPRHKFREELKNYFKVFSEMARLEGGRQQRSWYSGFLTEKFTSHSAIENETPFSLIIDHDISILDQEYGDCLAQYANENGKPGIKWEKCLSFLKDVTTSKLHWVQFPANHIVIDLDLKDESGEKSPQLNMEAASKFPPTYAEWSQSGKAIHLHYEYDGDPNTLSRLYSPGIEIKVFNGDASLRRKLSKCNNVPVAHLKSGLPLKGPKMINFEIVKSERGLRSLIDQNLRKEIHPGTKPSVDFIHKILMDAYDSDLIYDLTDLRPKVLSFASKSSNQSEYCVRLVAQMKFKSKEQAEAAKNKDSEPLVFFDIEVFPNLFICNWKLSGEKNKCVRMINPTPQDIEPLFSMKLVGFNCRRYDNHILYARYLGYDNLELFNISSKIINESRNAFFSEAFNVSYTDVYDFASAENKKGLKKFEIELGIHHQELDLPWDQPVPESEWLRVAEYCDNDVIATEKVFYHLSGDWTARKILADLSGLSVNDTTNRHAIRIIFGTNKKPQSEFVYTDLSTIFPGYQFSEGKSLYRGEETGEGGYVYAEPGIYHDVAVLDVASMHPSSIINLNLFGPYTKRFKEMKDSRIAIKHSNIKDLETLLEGQLMKYVERVAFGEFSMKDLSNALKTVLNSIYGLTSASFENECRDPRNVDNIVAKRGALFMVDLKNSVQEKGFKAIHIKTDSIKIPNATEEIIQFVFDFGKKYGYDFEHEVTYSDFCLVNDAVYIAKIGWPEKKAGQWTATGAQFAHPYVFKKLFSGEKIKFEDLCETKAVTSVMYLDMNEGLSEDEHRYRFVGRVGSYCPVIPGSGGGVLLREKDGKYYSVGGTKGYRWLEAEVVKELHKELDIDLRYHEELAQAAIKQISKFGDFNFFSDYKHDLAIPF